MPNLCKFVRSQTTYRSKRPQIDIYYPFSVLYRIDDVTDNSYYIGICESKEQWDKGYLGSGIRWNDHKKARPDHEYKRTILKENFETPKDLRNAELNEINKHVTKKGQRGIIIETKGKLLNTKVITKNSFYYKPKACSECGGKSGNHKKSCSKYKAPKACSECGSSYKHKEWCSHAKPANRCPECGGNNKHKKLVHVINHRKLFVLNVEEKRVRIKKNVHIIKK